MDVGSSSKTNLHLNIWSDDECELLLNVVIDYKNECAEKAVDWETNKSKLDDIHFRFMERINKKQQHPLDYGGEYNDSKTFTKDQLSDKLKMIYTGYRFSFDADRRSSFGGVAHLYFDLCTQLWGQAAAFNDKVKCTKRDEVNKKKLMNDNLLQLIYPHSEDKEKKRKTSLSDADKIFDSKYGRELSVDTNLQHYKKTKSKRKLPLENQLLTIANEDVALKKQLLQKLEEHSKRHQSNMESMLNQMEQQTQLISDGFSFMRSLILPEMENLNSLHLNSIQRPPVQNSLHYTSYVQQYIDDSARYPEQNIPENYFNHSLK